MNGMHGIIFSYEKKTGLRELIEQRIQGFQQVEIEVSDIRFHDSYPQTR
jgi:hypothetical protein